MSLEFARPLLLLLLPAYIALIYLIDRRGGRRSRRIKHRVARVMRCLLTCLCVLALAAPSVVLPGGQQAGAKGSQCGGGPAGGAGLGQGGHCRGSGLCGGGSFRVGSLSRGVGCGGSFGAVGVVRVSRGFRGGDVCGGVRCQRDLFHRQNRQF